MTGLLDMYFPAEDPMNPANLLPQGLLGPSVLSRMQQHSDAQRARMASGDYSPSRMDEDAMWLADDVAGGLLGSLPGGLMVLGTKALPMDQASRMARADEMFPVEAYHGTQRLDRLLEKPGLNQKRATSGPMPFFTDDQAIAAKYAEGKADTSLSAEMDPSYNDWFQFKFKGLRTPRNVEQAWYYLDPAEKASVKDKLSRIGYVDEEYSKIGMDGDNVAGAGRDHWDYTLRQHNGNALAAARDLWLDSGNLFDQEEKFAEVLKLAGLKNFTMENPNWSYSGVLPARLAIHKPFETTADNIASILPDMREAAKRKRGGNRNVDLWDKTSVSGQEWIRRLEEDVANGTTHAWTAIPDWATEVLKRKGFDGIKDSGGKGGGPGHAVWIPFTPEQVRSVHAAFDPAKRDSADLLAGMAGLSGLGLLAGTQYPYQEPAP